MSQRMLQGYKLLSKHCPMEGCNTPLLQSRGGEMWCEAFGARVGAPSAAPPRGRRRRRRGRRRRARRPRRSARAGATRPRPRSARSCCRAGRSSTRRARSPAASACRSCARRAPGRAARDYCVVCDRSSTTRATQRPARADFAASRLGGRARAAEGARAPDRARARAAPADARARARRPAPREASRAPLAPRRRGPSDASGRRARRAAAAVAAGALVSAIEDDASSAMATYMLQGWAMLADVRAPPPAATRRSCATARGRTVCVNPGCANHMKDAEALLAARTRTARSSERLRRRRLGGRQPRARRARARGGRARVAGSATAAAARAARLPAGAGAQDGDGSAGPRRSPPSSSASRRTRSPPSSRGEDARGALLSATDPTQYAGRTPCSAPWRSRAEAA